MSEQSETMSYLVDVLFGYHVFSSIFIGVFCFLFYRLPVRKALLITFFTFFAGVMLKCVYL